jgi:hypothetical protein
MIARRIPMLVLSIAAVIALVLTARTTIEPTQAVFSNVATPWMPAAPLPGGLTSTWFCPGVPAAGEDGAGGVVRVFNTGDAEMGGRLTVLTVDGEPVSQPVRVDPYAAQEFDLDALVDSPYAAAFVEIDGGGGLVEQLASNPEGESIATCANGPSNEWYLATGDTVENSRDLIVLSNPNDDDAIVDFTFATSAGVRQPQSLQNYPVPARSVRIVDVNDVRVEEPNVGVSVVASRGTVVMGRAQTFSQEARRGYVMSLGAPTLRDQWWFAHAVRSDSVDVSYTIYNPNDDDVEVQPVILGFPQTTEFQLPEAFVVPDGEVYVFELADIAEVPEGLVTMVFSSAQLDQGIVIERVSTQTVEGRPTTNVTLGATPRFADGYVAGTWYVGINPDVPIESGLTIYNSTAADAVITVQSITPGNGVQTVESLAEVTIPPYYAQSVDLTDPAVVGHPLIIRSTVPVYVERVLPREPEAQGRVSVWAVPANA